jgi:hypothetical protein
MALTYEWKLTGLKKQDTADLSDLVIGTRWELKGTNDAGVFGTFSGATPLDIPDADEPGYIAYADLTETQVLGWVKNIVSESAATQYMDHINEQIEKQISEKTYTLLEVQENDLPWSEASGSSDVASEAPTEPAEPAG